MTNENECLSFDLTLVERDVTIDGEAYVLVELGGTERDKYLTSLGKRIRLLPNGKPGGVKSFDGLEASLVATSLWKSLPSGRVPVTVATIQAWPARVVSALFEAAKELSALGEKSDDEDELGKNDWPESD